MTKTPWVLTEVSLDDLGVELEVEKKNIAMAWMTHQRDQRSFVVVSYYGHGDKRDITRRDLARLMEICDTRPMEFLLARDFNLPDQDYGASMAEGIMIDLAEYRHHRTGMLPMPT